MIRNSLSRRPWGWSLPHEILTSLPRHGWAAIADLAADFGVSCRVIRNALNRLTLEVPLHCDGGKVCIRPGHHAAADAKGLEYWAAVYERNLN